MLSRTGPSSSGINQLTVTLPLPLNPPATQARETRRQLNDTLLVRGQMESGEFKAATGRRKASNPIRRN
jgi:hypothetical protein